MNKPIVDKEIEATIFKDYGDSGVLRFSDRELSRFIGKKNKKYHLIVEEVI